MSWDEIDAFLAKHHIIALTIVLTGLYRVAKPILVSVREGVVEIVATGRAVAKAFGVTDAAIQAEIPAAEKAIPEIPDTPSFGVLLRRSEKKDS